MHQCVLRTVACTRSLHFEQNSLYSKIWTWKFIWRYIWLGKAFAYLCDLMCLYRRFLVEQVISQNLHWCVNEPAKWMFSMCILKLLLDDPVFPQMEQLCAFGPISGLVTIYWYSSLSPPVTEECAQSHLKWGNWLSAHSHHVIVHLGFGVKFLLAILARVSKWSRKV